jgi:hypothetical protein
MPRQNNIQLKKMGKQPGLTLIGEAYFQVQRKNIQRTDC